MISERARPVVGDVVRVLSDAYPLGTAEPWDRVGLIVGDPALVATGVLVTLDATAEAVARAVAAGANVLVTHHPPYLEPPASLAPGPGAAGAAMAAAQAGVALVAMHTNLDASVEGAEALPRLLGFTPVEPVRHTLEQVSVVVAYVPEADGETVRLAMSAAGAGEIGAYTGCAFTAPGTGHFHPGTAARPAVAARTEGVAEVRVEMVAPRHRVPEVLAAARAAHPYEEPVLLAVDAVRGLADIGLGRICTWREGVTVRDVAAHVSRTLGVGVRVHGLATAAVSRIAVAGGSAGSLVPSLVGRADVLVAGEVRYHDALDAMAAGIAVIEAGHDSTEFALVGLLAQTLANGLPTLRVVTELEQTATWTLEA